MRVLASHRKAFRDVTQWAGMVDRNRSMNRKARSTRKRNKRALLSISPGQADTTLRKTNELEE